MSKIFPAWTCTHRRMQSYSECLMVGKSENYPRNLGSVRIRPSAVKSSFCGTALCSQLWVLRVAFFSLYRSPRQRRLA